MIQTRTQNEINDVNFITNWGYKQSTAQQNDVSVKRFYHISSH